MHPDKTETKRITLDEILEATGGKLIGLGEDFFSGVSIDSRKTGTGELFVALKGDKFDGHDFLGSALERGSGAIISRELQHPVQGKTIVSVEDTLSALQAIARYRRLQSGVPVVAVTGSNGKTTTKELTAAVLGARYRVLKNAGNLNNHIGLPLSLAGLTGEVEAVVLEMGASAPGEIRQLCDIAAPDYGVLTNIGRAHLEGFRDIETIRKTKLEILDYVKVAVVNADDSFLMKGLEGSDFQGKIFRYGIDNQADVYATDIRLHERGSAFTLHTPEASAEVHSRISGLFNIYNILAASATGVLLRVRAEDIGRAVGLFEGVPMRLESRDMDGISVLNDVYNANPGSMEAAVRELARIRKGRAIAVLGDMLELGAYSEEAHKGVVAILNDLNIDIFIAVGPQMSAVSPEFRGEHHLVNSSADARELLRTVWRKGDSVLIKGSRGMKMERVLADEL